MSAFIKKLERLYQQKGIEAIDVERCRFFLQQEPKISDDVLKAVFLTGYRFRQGDVCVSLEEYAGQPLLDEPESSSKLLAPGLAQWKVSLGKSPLVGLPGQFTPLIIDTNDRVYFQKYWMQEETLAKSLLKRCEQKSNIDDDLLREGLNRLFGLAATEEPDWQKAATAVSVKNKLSVISGGPGTGKTTTVVRILALLIEQSLAKQQSARIALAAPTGKAAARLKESIRLAKARINVDDEIRQLIPEEAKTLHQLLGARRHSSRFKYSEKNTLPFKTVVLDEASMADQTLMSSLIKALPDASRLILLGDKDQLASVEAGSVLGDICFKAANIVSTRMNQWLRSINIALPEQSVTSKLFRMNDHVTLLTKNYRFAEKSGIGQLAKNINSGDGEGALQIITSGRFTDIDFTIVTKHAELLQKLEYITANHFIPFFQNLKQEAAFEQWQDFQLLAVHRRGPYGVQYLNRQIERILIQRGVIPNHQLWYAGRPVIINTNDYNLKLYNGDVGICLRNKKGELRVYFQQKDEIRAFAPARLSSHSSAYVLTVHKSQGDEFRNVGLILPSKESKVLSRELVYTAVTRARESVQIIGSEEVLKAAITKKMKRSSGLGGRLWDE